MSNDKWKMERSLLTKSLQILTRSNEGFNHLGLHKVAVELIQLRQPEVVTRKIRVGRVIRIAPQIAKVFHQHESAIEFLLGQHRVLRHIAQSTRSLYRVGRCC